MGAGSQGWRLNNFSEDIAGYTTQSSFAKGASVPAMSVSFCWATAVNMLLPVANSTAPESVITMPRDSSFTLAIFESDITWKPPESVRIVQSQFMNL